MLQQMYAVHYRGMTYNMFAFSERDALRKAKELYDEMHREDDNEESGDRTEV